MGSPDGPVTSTYDTAYPSAESGMSPAEVHENDARARDFYVETAVVQRAYEAVKGARTSPAIKNRACSKSDAGADAHTPLASRQSNRRLDPRRERPDATEHDHEYYGLRLGSAREFLIRPGGTHAQLGSTPHEPRTSSAVARRYCAYRVDYSNQNPVKGGSASGGGLTVSVTATSKPHPRPPQ